MSFFNSDNKDKKQNLKDSIKKIMEKYPDRVPVYVSRSKKDRTLPSINNNKFIVPDNITVSDLITIIRKRIKIGQETSIFVFVNEGTIPQGSSTMGNLYQEYKNEDDMLIIEYCGENVFGNF